MRKSQRGVTLIELVIGLAILSSLMLGITAIMRNQAQSKQNAVAARQLVEFVDASEAYVRANYTTIIGTAGATTPVVIGVPQLQAAGLLPASYPATNVFGQTPTARARKPTATTLETLVVHTGGVALQDNDLDEIAGFASQGGVAAGSVPWTDPSRAVGTLGSWSLPLSNFNVTPGAGRIAANLSYSSEATNDTALHRQSIPGRPDLNRMSTAIDMGGNNVNSAGTVDATELKASQIALGSNRYGGAAYPYETISLPGGNNFRFNIGGVQQAYIGGDGWFESRYGLRTSYASVWDLNANGGINSNNHVYARTNVQTDGEMYATGWFRTRGDTGWYSEKWGGGWHMTDATWIRAYGGKNVYTPGEMRANRMSTEGRITSGEFVQIQGTSYRGWGCDTGSLGREPDGTGLYCKNGVFQPMGGGPTSGYHSYLGQFYGPYTGYNTSPFTSFVTVEGMAQPCGQYNGYSFAISVNGVWLGVSQNNNRDYAKVGHTTFPVPAGGNFTITPQWTGTCNTRVSVWQYTQT